MSISVRIIDVRALVVVDVVVVVVVVVVDGGGGGGSDFPPPGISPARVETDTTRVRASARNTFFIGRVSVV
jgi:hypothetical protein